MSVFGGSESDDGTALARLAALEAAMAELATTVGTNAGAAGDAVAGEATTRASGDQALTTAIQAEETARIAGDTDLATQLGAEIQARIAGDEAALGNEASARVLADAALGLRIDDEITARGAAVTGEATTRANADTALGIRIDGEITARGAAVTGEATTRANADTALGVRIDGEITARGAAVTGEATTRANADTALGVRIDGEATTRTNADTALGARIDGEIVARAAGDANIVASLPRRSSRAADNSIQSTTALAVDADLSVTLGANVLAFLRGRIFYASGATGDLKYRFDGPAAPVAVQIKRQTLAPGATSYSGIALDTSYSGSDIVVDGGAGAGLIEFEALVQNGANAGDFVFKWAQSATEAVNTTVKAGSWIECSLLPWTSAFAFANTAIAKLGAFVTGFSAGHNLVNASLGEGNSRLETIATGTKLEAQLNGTTPTFTCTVDGGAPFTITVPAGWSWVTIFSGLSDGPHRVTISGQYIESDNTLRVTGSVPAIARPSDIPNIYRLGSAPFITYGATEGVTLINQNLFPAPYQRQWTAGAGFGLRFKATTTSIRLWMYNKANPSRMIVLQDGVQIADVTPSGTGSGYDLVTLKTGLPLTSCEYEIKMIEVGRTTYIYDLLVDALDTVVHTAKPIDAHYGDSIAAETNAGGGVTFDARNGDAYQIAAASGHSAVLLGTGGAKVSTALRDGTARVTGLPVLPDRVFITAGTNDMFAAVPLATFRADYKTMLSNLRAGLSSGQKIYARGILPRVGYTAQRLAYNTEMQAAVAETADPNIIYVNTDDWIDATAGVDTVEGLHPNVAGYAKMTARQLAAL